MIAAIGITTRDRPVRLERCARSYIANARVFGRRPRLIILDDAVPGVHASALPATLAIARDNPDFEILYAGAAEKRRFVATLAEQGIPRDLLEFALLDPEAGGYTLGANRNALMLETLGEHVLYVDDDSLAQTARPPAWDEDLAIVGLGTTQRYWFYPSHAAARDAARFETVDLLGAHEAYLGKPCREVIAAHRGEIRSGGGPWAAHLRDHGVVKVTQNGLVGDSCMFSNIGHLLHARGEGRERLVGDPDMLALAMSSREIIRSPACPTLRMGGLLIGPDWGCDHSAPLPPYFPLYRSSDTSFSNLLSLTDRSWAFADIPWLVLHEAEPGRRYNERGVAAPWRCSAGEALRQLMQAQSATAYRSHRDPLGSIGERLLAQAALPPVDFAALVRALVGELIEMKLARLSHSLESAVPVSAHYARAVRRSVALLQTSLDDPACHVPVELAEGRSPQEALAQLQRLVGRFGALLRGWREIDAAVRGKVRLAIEPGRA